MARQFLSRKGFTKPLVCCAIFLFLVMITLASSASAALLGDVNNDGIINVQDVVLVNSHVLGLSTLTSTQKIAADVNGDGTINILDVTLITQMSLGLISDFPLLPSPLLTSPADEAFIPGQSVNFQWAASRGANMYSLEVIRISDESVFKNPVLGNVTSTTQLGFPNDGSEYKWRVRAGIDNIWGTWSTYRTFTNGTLPAAPALLSPAENANAAGTAVNFQWASSSGADRYELEIVRTSDNTVFKNQAFGNVTSSTQSGFLDDNSQYKWRVRSGNAAGWGLWSAYRSFINGKAVAASVPAVPILLSPADKINIEGTSISFEWQPSDGANRYELEIREATSGEPIFRSVLLDNVSASLQGGFPNDGTQYKWRVKAGNAAGWSSWSGYRYFNNGIIPAAPLLLTPLNNANIAGRSISFSWTASAGADKYEFEIIKQSDGVVFYNKLVTTTSTIIDGFYSDSTQYRWRVRAINKYGPGLWSDYRNLTNGTTIAAPALVSPAPNAYIFKDSIMFEWKRVSEANRYELLIIRASDGYVFRNVILGNTSASLQMNFPDDGTQYKWRVRGGNINSDKWGHWSEERYFINGNLLTAPALLSPVDYVYVPGESIEFKWAASTGATKYQLEIMRARDSAVIKIADITTLNSTQAIFLNDGTQYRWRVRGGNNIGWGAWSGYWNFINETPELDLTAPILLSPQADSLVGGSAIQFQWGSVPTANRYNLQVVRARDGVILHDVVRLGTSPPALPDFPDDGTKYLWRVRAGIIDGSDISWGCWSFYRSLTNGFWWMNLW